MLCESSFTKDVEHMVYSTSLYLQIVQVAMGETTTGARGVFVPMAEGETPPPQVAAATS